MMVQAGDPPLADVTLVATITKKEKRLRIARPDPKPLVVP